MSPVKWGDFVLEGCLRRLYSERVENGILQNDQALCKEPIGT